MMRVLAIGAALVVGSALAALVYWACYAFLVRFSELSR